MPLTPETWLSEFTVNLTTTGGQSQPKIINLANGNILVVWVSDDNTGVGSPAGIDLIGQLFTPLGERIGGEFLVNAGASGEAENDPDIAALPGGGFLTVFERPTASGFSDIALQEHDANGAVLTTVFPFFDSNTNANPATADPEVAVFSNTSALVVWREFEAGGTDSRIVGKFYDSTTNTLGAEISLINFAGSNAAPDVTALTNGNYAIVGQTLNGSDNEITLRIINGAGGNVLSATAIAETSGDASPDSEPSVTALTGGGFVVAWSNTDSNDSDIEARVFNAAGVPQGGLITIPLGTADDNANEPVVIPLLDGGFVIMFDEDTDGQLRVQRYSSTGAEVGVEFVVATGFGITQPDADLLDDGRIAITFVRDNGEIGMEIIDTRDQPNNPGVYTPAQWQVGTVGDDIFTADAGSEFVAAFDGNDTVTESGQIRTYLMGNGNDTLLAVSPINDDVHDGGAGTDTIDWSGASTFVIGATFNLATGSVTQGSESEVMIGFENLTGTTNNDSITGTAGANILIGLAGNDIIDGGTGADTMAGGDGNDTYGVRDATDIVDETGATGTDTVNAVVTVSLSDAVHFKGNIENVTLLGALNLNATGNALANLLIGNSGNNTLNGLGAADTMRGLGGNDLYGVENAGDVVDESVAGSGGIDTVNATVTVSLLDVAHFKGDIENVSLFGAGNISATGNNISNVLTGNGGNNTLNGNGGTDTMFGLGGNDTYGVHQITDVVNEAVAGSGGIDTVNSVVNMSLVAVGGASVALGAVENITLFGAGNVFAFGNALANVLIGNGGNNTLAGGLGNDTLTGNGGADIFVFNTVPNAATNMDNITDMNQAGNDTIHLENAVFAGLAAGALAAGAFVSNGTGLAGDADDRIIYNIATGQLFFDSNGNAAGGSVQFALLDAGLAMSAADFFVI